MPENPTENQEKVQEPQEPSQEEKLFISEYMALTKEGSLVKKGKITVRMFSMVSGGTIVAHTFSELPDSYIVAFPAMMVSDDNKVQAKMISPANLVRVYKTSIVLSAMPIPKFLLSYLIACKDKVKELPGFFTEERRSQINIMIEALKSQLGITTISVMDETEVKKVKATRKVQDNSESWDEKTYVSGPKTVKYKH